MKPLKLRSKSAQPLMHPLENRRLLSVTPAINFTADATSSTVTGYTPAQIQSAYGFNQLSFNSGKTAANGAGQTIAIVDAYNDPNIAGDLKTFDTRFGLAAADLKVVNQTGGSKLPASNGGWAEEISLDVEWAHSIAPGANILLVETSSDSNSSLLAGVNYARNAAGVSVVSMSWGGSEFSGETAYDSYFTTPSGHTGVTFIAASGDDGSAGGVDWPASSPDVLSVGGTSLSITSTGAYSSETGWSDSGGGVSRFEGEPEYQTGVQSDDARTVPDVAADANPSTGVAVYDSYTYDGASGWEEFGGTSAAAPQWAGLISIADQGRVLSKLGTLNGSTNTLPTLYSLESSSGTYSADFHDITSGASSFSTRAGAGYDLVTGLGSAKANNLVPALVASTTTTKLTLTAPEVRTRRPPRFGFFVSTSHGAIPAEVLDGSQTTFVTTVQTSEPLQINQGVFETNLPAINAVSVTSIHPGLLPAGDSNAPAAVSHTAGNPVVAAPASAATPLLQSVETELQAVKTYAQEMIGQMVRDVAIDLSHLEISPGDDLIAAPLHNSGDSWRIAAAVAGAAVVAGAVVQKEKQKPNGVFSTKLIEAGRHGDSVISPGSFFLLR
jgi:subtilase family serine protease